MKIIRNTEKKFWLLFILALIFGIFVPFAGKQLSFLVVPVLMIVLFLTYLKINFLEVLAHIKKPFFIFYILLIFLLIIPIIFYEVFHLFNTELAIGVLLLCAMPPGVAAPALTDIVKGNTTLSLAVSLLAYIFAPFTFLLLFILFNQKTIHLDIASLSTTLLYMNFIPLIAAQIVRKTGKSFILKTQNYYSFINICLLAIMVYIVMSAQSKEVLAQPVSTIIYTVMFYIIFLLLNFLGYFVAFWRKKEDKVALSISKTYMNNGLAIALAFTFFNPKIALLMVLSEIPWNTTLGLFRFIYKYLK